MILYHVTTGKKVKEYQSSGYIKRPVRGFTTLQGAMAWAIKTGRKIILEIESDDTHKLPDHHNEWGDAYWCDEDVAEWKCVYSPENHA